MHDEGVRATAGEKGVKGCLVVQEPLGRDREGKLTAATEEVDARDQSERGYGRSRQHTDLIDRELEGTQRCGVYGDRQPMHDEGVRATAGEKSIKRRVEINSAVGRNSKGKFRATC